MTSSRNSRAAMHYLACCFWLVLVKAAVPRLDSSMSSYFSVSEDFPVGNILKQFRVTDAESGDQITVAIATPETRRLVNINQTGHGNDVTVDIILKTKLDRDTPGSSQRDLVFTATDKVGNEIQIRFSMSITDVNDNAPSFERLSYRTVVKENTVWPSSVPGINLIATDPDNGYNGYVTYTMTSNSTKADYMATFGINNVTGVVTLKKGLDYETNTFYQFWVYAEDHGTPPLTGTTNLIIQVQDVQDTPPFFTGIPYRRTIDENIPVGTSLLKAEARDGDSGVSNSLSYSILTGDCSDFFTISTDGDIHVARDIDRDTGEIKDKYGVCSFPVQASEINGTQPQYGNSTTTTNVTIIVMDENDNSPVFSGNTYTANVRENTASGIPVTMVTPLFVTDADEGERARMVITLVYPNKTVCSDFAPSPDVIRATGSIMIEVKNSALLDYEERKHITFLVVATEAANHSHIATATVVLDLVDVNVEIDPPIG